MKAEFGKRQVVVEETRTVPEDLATAVNKVAISRSWNRAARALAHALRGSIEESTSILERLRLEIDADGLIPSSRVDGLSARLGFRDGDLDGNGLRAMLVSRVLESHALGFRLNLERVVALSDGNERKSQ